LSLPHNALRVVLPFFTKYKYYDFFGNYVD
jgi:hypothetical protein